MDNNFRKKDKNYKAKEIIKKSKILKIFLVVIN